MPDDLGWLDDRYHLVRLLGGGGYGQVYQAYDDDLKRDVAIKFIHRLSERAGEQGMLEGGLADLKEAKAATLLKHTNIASLYAIGVNDEGIPYLVMEHVPGQSLESVISVDGPLPLLVALDVFCQLSSALEHAHEHGVLHRDIKPANVILLKDNDGNYVSKLIDFGLAKFRTAQNQSVTREELIFGTPVYMSPEYILGQRYDERCDIYSLGLLMYEVLSGKRANQGDGPAAAMQLAISASPQPFSKICPERLIPQPLENVIWRTLAKNPSARYQTMSELVADLVQIADGLKSGKTLPSIAMPTNVAWTNAATTKQKAANLLKQRRVLLSALLLIVVMVSPWIVVSANPRVRIELMKFVHADPRIVAQVARSAAHDCIARGEPGQAAQIYENMIMPNLSQLDEADIPDCLCAYANLIAQTGPPIKLDYVLSICEDHERHLVPGQNARLLQTWRAASLTIRELKSAGEPWPRRKLAALAQIGSSATQDGCLEVAERAYKDLLTLSSSQDPSLAPQAVAEAKIGFGEIAHLQGHDQQALAYFEQAVNSMEPDCFFKTEWAPHFEELLDLYESTGRPELGQALIAKIQAAIAGRETPQLLLMVARMQRRFYQDDAADKTYQQAARLAKNQPWVLLSVLSARIDNWFDMGSCRADAEAAVQQELDLTKDLNSMDLRRLRAVAQALAVFNAHNQAGKADTLFTSTAAEIGDNLYTVPVCQGLIDRRLDMLANLGKNEEYIKLCQKVIDRRLAVKEAIGLSGLYRTLADRLLARGDPDGALEALQGSRLHLAPGSDDLGRHCQSLGAAMAAKNNYGQAEAAAQQALKLPPKFFQDWGRLNLPRYLMLDDKSAAGEKLISDYVNSLPGNWHNRATYSLAPLYAEILLDQKKYDQCEKFCTDFAAQIAHENLRQEATLSCMYACAGDAQRDSGQLIAAQKSYARALATPSTSSFVGLEAGLGLALIQSARGQTKQAEKQLESAITQAQQSGLNRNYTVPAMVALVRLQRQQHEAAKARATLTEALSAATHYGTSRKVAHALEDEAVLLDKELKVPEATDPLYQQAIKLIHPDT